MTTLHQPVPCISPLPITLSIYALCQALVGQPWGIGKLSYLVIQPTSLHVKQIKALKGITLMKKSYR